jgi:hypothetical protein
MTHRHAQRGCFLQIGDAEDIRLVRDGLGNLNHAMAIGIRFDDSDKLDTALKFFADKRHVMTQSVAIDLSPTAVMRFHHFCPARGVVMCGSRR